MTKQSKTFIDFQNGLPEWNGDMDAGPTRGRLVR
jgi:hypothetical protein